MEAWLAAIKRARFYATAALLNIASVTGIAYAYKPAIFAAPASSQPVLVREVAQPLPPPPKPIISGKPVRLIIPSLELDLQVIDGKFDSATGAWELSENVIVHYALPTPPVNDHSGNTLIYGHNNNYVFGYLYLLKPGDSAIVHTDNGHIFTYQFESAVDVPPEDLSIFDPSSEPRLTLQTCSGILLELRRLSQFKLVGVGS
jgi:LPXTG-site transpeptidase (sortase) family protein